MFQVVFLAVLLMSCSQIASQIYIPVLPTITDSLQLTPSQGQAAVISYFTTLGAAQLLVGPLRDKFGDRPLFFSGLGILLLGTVFCSIASSAEVFFIGRVLQGIGAASPVLIGRTLLAARLSGAELKSAMATLAMSVSVTAICSPFLAGVLSGWVGWQGMSWFAFAYYVLILVYGYRIMQQSSKTTLSLRPNALFYEYQSLLLNRSFISLASLKWLPTFLYLTIQLYLPFLLARQFGLESKAIGQAMMLPMFGLLIGSILTKVLQRKRSYLDIVIWTWPALVVSVLLLLFASGSALAVLLAYAAIMFVFGAYFPSYMHLIGVLHPEKAGTANALVGAVELLFFSCVAWVVNKWLLSGVESLAVLVFGCALLLFLTWRHLCTVFMPVCKE
ncbi:MFS transporter [Pseudoalteromonas piscicida]|uniref:MFS transporter n=1 Tax=Pseudoalteromonas TaxID=53246 RepID=UPI001D0B8D01|nr:MFS transporter [Pseudoalteromonas piscicida]